MPNRLEGNTELISAVFNYILKLKYACWIVTNFVFPQPLHYKNCNTNRWERTVLILVRKILEFPVLTNQVFVLMIERSKGREKEEYIQGTCRESGSSAGRRLKGNGWKVAFEPEG